MFLYFDCRALIKYGSDRKLNQQKRDLKKWWFKFSALIILVIKVYLKDFDNNNTA